MTISFPLFGSTLSLRKPIAVALVVLLSALFLAGCRNNQDTTTPSDGPQLLTTLPSTWEAMNFGRSGLFSQSQPWLEVNIDGDATPEYILFFTYDSGQVGAVIYDWQTGRQPAQATSPIVPASQPAGTYVPYRLEPNYWPGAGPVGFLALPGTTSDAIQLYPVVRTQPAAAVAAAATEVATAVAAAAAPDATAIPVSAADVATTAPITPTATPAATATATAAPASGNNELIIFGGSGVISTVWWQNQPLGYGIAQISAPYSIVRINRGNNGNGSVLSAVGLTRLSGPLQRNFMCEAELFTRAASAPLPSTQPLFQQPVTYQTTQLGKTFCNGPPANPPYYPEGVVQAFVQPYNPDSGSFEPRQYDSMRQQLLAPSIAGELSTLVDLVTYTDRTGNAVATLVDDLVTPYTVTVPSTVQFTSPTSAITTPVCVQIRSLSGTDLPRRLIFVLQHVAPSQEAQKNGTIATTDQMQIIYASDVTGAAKDCETIIGMPILIAGPPP